jgi:5-methyltetrahydropteroyltriglutamate--homocysteine methyltransferase
MRQVVRRFGFPRAHNPPPRRGAPATAVVLGSGVPQRIVSLTGMRAEFTFRELQDYRSQQGMGFRARPPAVCDGPIGPGTLDLVAPCARARRLAGRPLKFTLTGPHMLAKTVIDRHYGDVAALAAAITEVLAEQVALLDAEVIQIDEANLPGHPDEWPWAAAAINRVLDAVRTTPAVHLCFGNYGGQVAQRGTWATLIDYLDALHVDQVVLESATGRRRNWRRSRSCGRKSTAASA